MSIDAHEVKTLFCQALELPTALQRAELLDRACAGRPVLKARVEELLRAAEAPDSILDHPLGHSAATFLAPHSGACTALAFLEPSSQAGSLGRLGGYEVLEVIGRGGMGIVLRALDVKLNRVVAIKVLAPEQAHDSQARQRFLREAQAAAAVSHDHVVTIHAVDEGTPSINAPPFLVMECIVGQSLQQKIDATGPLEIKEILRIGLQVASGLAAAHRQGLVHRDIKPANILLENGVERVKITDFGLARASRDAALTQTGMIVGTPQYMSPEQAQGSPVDHRSDLFSLGSVLYALCTGRPAFRADSTVAVLRRVCDETPRPIAETNTEIPEWLIDVIGRLMAKLPEQRFQSAQAVAEVLERGLAQSQQPALQRAQDEEPSETESLTGFPATVLEGVNGMLGIAFVMTVGTMVAGGVGWIPSAYATTYLGYQNAVLVCVLLGALVAIWIHGHWYAEPPNRSVPTENAPSSAERLSPLASALITLITSVLGFMALVACATWASGGIWWAALGGLLLGLLVVWRIHVYESTPSTAPPHDERAAGDRGLLSRAFHEWWSERDRWTTCAVQAALVLAYVVCMICFISFGMSSGFDANGNVLFSFRLGIPGPWFTFEVYPEPQIPFRSGFHLWSSSVLIGLAGCLAFGAYWRIEKVRHPTVSRWGGPPFMLGVWGVGALCALGLGHWLGYDALARSRLKVDRAGAHSTIDEPAATPQDVAEESEGSDSPTMALLNAAEHGQAGRIQQLLEAGVSVNAKGSDGQTPLMKAVAAGHRSLALSLLVRGASLLEQDEQGRTALTIAVERRDATLIQKIWDLWGVCNTSPADNRQRDLRAFPSLEPVLVEGREMVLTGIDIHAAERMGDNLGETPSMKAARAGDWKCFYLLANSVDSLLARDKHGRTVLMHALLGGQLKQPEWRDLFGNLAHAPYFGIVDREVQYTGTMLIFELERSLSVLDNDEKSALQIAEELGQRELAGILRRHLEAIVANQTALIAQEPDAPEHIRLQSLARQALGQ